MGIYIWFIVKFQVQISNFPNSVLYVVEIAVFNLTRREG